MKKGFYKAIESWAYYNKIVPGSSLMAVIGEHNDRYCGGKRIYGTCIEDKTDHVKIKITESSWESLPVDAIITVGKHSVYVYTPDPPEQTKLDF